MISHNELRQLFKEFWEEREHKEIPPIPLVPKDDPTTLFTGSGMQQLVPYLLGEPHPLGQKLYNIQPCFRSQDIEEVGDNRHDTFFEMMGNWSLGTYFKKEQLSWFWEFLTQVLKLPKERLYVTVFSGSKEIPEDKESYEIWKSLGVPENRIFKYGPDNNWWSRAGSPKDMPVGEPGGPDSEVFYEFTQIPHIPQKPHSSACHPNCQCGRFLEIGNSVFMQYKKNSDETFSELPKKNVDFGGGLERILAAVNNDPDIFKTDIFWPIIEEIEKQSNKKYSEIKYQAPMRVLADHIKSAIFLISSGVEPSNKLQGYVLRRLIRKSVVKMLILDINIEKAVPAICEKILNIYSGEDFDLKKECEQTIGNEADNFKNVIHQGTKLLQTQPISGELLFKLHQSNGFPFEIAEELLAEWGKPIGNKEREEFNLEQKKHQELSRKSSIGLFKGGLADQSEQTLKYHTATHLLHQALFDILGNEVRQEGSNITNERLRFDFYSTQHPQPPQIKQVEQIINEKIKEGLRVEYKILPKQEAEKLGVRSFFREKYPDMVKVYFIGNYSKEFCGGPHVKNTKEIGKIAIYKFEKIGSNLYRIYAR